MQQIGGDLVEWISIGGSCWWFVPWSDRDGSDRLGIFLMGWTRPPYHWIATGALLSMVNVASVASQILPSPKPGKLKDAFRICCLGCFFCQAGLKLQHMLRWCFLYVTPEDLDLSYYFVLMWECDLFLTHLSHLRFTPPKKNTTPPGFCVGLLVASRNVNKLPETSTNMLLLANSKVTQLNLVMLGDPSWKFSGWMVKKWRENGTKWDCTCFFYCSLCFFFGGGLGFCFVRVFCWICCFSK